MDNSTTAIVLPLMFEVKTEPGTEENDKIDTFPQSDILMENSLKAEQLELKKGGLFDKECLVKNYGEYDVDMSLQVSSSDEEKYPQSALGCDQITSNQTEPLVKIEKREAIEEDEKMYYVNPADWAIKNEGLDENEEDLKTNQTRFNDYISNPTETVETIEKSEAEDADAQIGDVNFDDFNMKNEELGIKDEDLESNNFSILQSQVGSETHLLRHESPEELIVFKCNQCEYQSIYKQYLRKHIRRHHKNSKKVNMLKCDQCKFQTIHDSALHRHRLLHKNPEEVNMFKCDVCDYQSIQKRNLTRHLLRHKNPEEVQMFKCDHCDYQTVRKHNLNIHLLIHKNPEDVTMIKCDQCKFQTIHEGDLKRHRLLHKNPEEVNMFKCDVCDYQSIYKRNLNRHLLRHRNPEEVQMFKCNQCDYQTVYKGSIKRHLLHRHNDPKDVDVLIRDPRDHK